MTPTPIYRDHTGWREVNPFPHERQEFDPDRGFDYTGLTENENYTKLEQSIQYFDFPSAPDVELGVVVMAELQWQFKDDDGVWKEPSDDLNEDRRYTGTPKRQIWLAANQEIKDACECGVPEAVHGTSCGWANACYTIDAETDEEKGWNREWVKAHPQIHLSGESTFNQEGKEEQAKEETSKIDNIFEETVEQAAIRYMMVTDLPYDGENDYIIGFTKGANWQNKKQSPSAPKAEVSAEEIAKKYAADFVWPVKGLSYDVQLTYQNKAMFELLQETWLKGHEYAALKTSSLQQENKWQKETIGNLNDECVAHKKEIERLTQQLEEYKSSLKALVREIIEQTKKY